MQGKTYTAFLREQKLDLTVTLKISLEMNQE